jgi:hypothetical protein
MFVILLAFYGLGRMVVVTSRSSRSIRLAVLSSETTLGAITVIAAQIHWRLRPA